MPIDGISGLSGALGGGFGATAKPAGGEGAGGFGALLNDLSAAQGQADTAVNDIAVGSDRDLHDTVLAVEMESLAFDLAVQIRNRMVDAYQEIFRMSV